MSIEHQGPSPEEMGLPEGKNPEDEKKDGEIEASDSSKSVESTPIPEAEYEKILAEKMCVLRSFASVGEAFNKNAVVLDHSLVEQRLAQMKEREEEAAKQIEQLTNTQQQNGETPTFTFFKQLEAIASSRSQDKLNIKSMLKILTNGTGKENALEASLSGLTARYEAVHGYNNLIKLLKNPNEQTCLAIGGHLMHVSLDKQDRMVSLSDREEGIPLPVNALEVAMQLYNAPEDYNAIVFSKEDKLTPDVFERLNSDFLSVSDNDPDLLRAAEKTEGADNRPLYSPDMDLVKNSLYPEVTDYKKSDRTTGKLEKSEAIAIGCLARKTAILEMALSESADVTEKLRQLYQEKASEVGLRKIPDKIWLHDVSDGMKQFAEAMNRVSYAREKLQTPEAPKNVKKRKQMGRTNREIRLEEDKQLFSGPLTQDGNKIGQKTAVVLASELSNQHDISEHNPGGARNAEEIEKRILSWELGVKIARDLYLDVLRIKS